MFGKHTSPTKLFVTFWTSVVEILQSNGLIHGPLAPTFLDVFLDRIIFTKVFEAAWTRGLLLHVDDLDVVTESGRTGELVFAPITGMPLRHIVHVCLVIQEDFLRLESGSADGAFVFLLDWDAAVVMLVGDVHVQTFEMLPTMRTFFQFVPMESLEVNFQSDGIGKAFSA